MSISTLGRTTAAAVPSQTFHSFMYGNLYTATQSGSLIDIVQTITGANLAGADEKMRQIVYHAATVAPDYSGWTLVGASAEYVVPGLAPLADYTETISGLIVAGQTYLLGQWSGPSGNGDNTFCQPLQQSSGGSLTNYFTPNAYSSAGAAPAFWPTASAGTNVSEYGKLYVDFTPSTVAAIGGEWAGNDWKGSDWRP